MSTMVTNFKLQFIVFRLSIFVVGIHAIGLPTLCRWLWTLISETIMD